MLKFLQAMPYVFLVPLALLMALAPFGTTPHFIEKWRMLFAGTLRRPLDWFDLVMHSTPVALLLLKVSSDLYAKMR